MIKQSRLLKIASMKSWNCIKHHIDKWRDLIGVDPFDTKEFITAVNKQSHKLDRLSNIKASQIGRGVVYVAMLLTACSSNIYNKTNIMGHETSFPIGTTQPKDLEHIETAEQIAEFIDSHIEVHKDADVAYRGYKELIIEVKDSTGNFRAGATCVAMANSNRLMRPLSNSIEQFFNSLNTIEFDIEYWHELAYKHKQTTKKELLLEKIKELEDVHLQIDVPSWGENLHKYFLTDYNTLKCKRINIIFELIYLARNPEYEKLLWNLAAIVEEASLIDARLQTLAHTIVDKGVDELWLVKREGYIRVSNIKYIGDFIDVKSISTGRANATMKSCA